MFRRRVTSYDSKDDLEQIMWKLMGMDEKLDEILSQVSEEESDEEEPD